MCAGSTALSTYAFVVLFVFVIMLVWSAIYGSCTAAFSMPYYGIPLREDKDIIDKPFNFFAAHVCLARVPLEDHSLVGPHIEVLRVMAPAIEHLADGFFSNSLAEGWGGLYIVSYHRKDRLRRFR